MFTVGKNALMDFVFALRHNTCILTLMLSYLLLVMHGNIFVIQILRKVCLYWSRAGSIASMEHIADMISRM
jgi:hypothetical protein